MGQGALASFRLGESRRAISLSSVLLGALLAVAAPGCGNETTMERPCPAICNGPTPICDPVARRCVGCLSDDDCPMGQICADNACKAGCSTQRPDCPAGKMCDLKLAICRGCRADAECTDMAMPRCEVAKERCVPCLLNNDNCKAGTRCVASGDSYQCTTKCKAKADCMFVGAPPMSECCNSLCVDLAASTDNCGACGRTCGGKACCGATCIDTTSDLKNCGGCGKTCNLPNATAGCAASACTVASCNGGFGDCNQQAMDGCEVDVTNSVANCGACQMVCPVPPGGTAACAMGVCGIGMCNAGLADCDKMSMNGCEVDLASNANHCAACGMACPRVPNAASTCAQGVCGIGGCLMGFADCDKVQMNGCEASIASDVNNCGVCGYQCSVINGSSLCLAGMCVLGSCSPGYKDCNGQLVDGCEINAAVDSKNCGSCGNSCNNTPHAVAGCAAGVCGIGKCDAGWGDCDKMPNNGCETGLTSDALNCGACGMKCPAPPNVAITCTNSVCAMGGCSQGYSDCNNNLLADGCEAKLSSDPKNCGKCGTVCPAITNGTPGCAMGICGVGSCNADFGDCNNNPNDGCETKTDTDANNCGGCGKVCMANWKCTGGVCLPPLDPDLVLYYDFEEQNGDAIDRAITGVQTNGTFQGTITRSNDAAKGLGSIHAPANSGAGDRVHINGVVSDLNMAGPYSVMAWVKVLSAGAGRGIIVLGTCCTSFDGIVNHNREGYTLNIAAANQLRFWGGSDKDDTNYNATHTFNIVDSKWHHIGYRVDMQKVEFVVDGVPGTVTQGSNIPTSPTYLNPNELGHGPGAPHIGGQGISSAVGADCYIDEVRVYKRFLNDQDWANAMAGN